MLQDVRFALRLIAKERWYSAVAILALALGIGVNATVYALVDAALFRPLPFKDPGRLYTLSWQPSSSGGRSNTSYPDFLEWRQQTRAFGGLAAFTNSSFNISDDRLFPEQVRGASVTPNLFELLGHRPVAGRGFLAEDDRQGANRVVVLGERIWRNRYGGDLSVLGTTVRVNGEAATVIGVMPGMMQFPNNAEVWVPFIPTPQQQVRTSRPLNVIARLRDGASLAEAQAESNAIAARLAAAYPDTNKQFTRARIETFKERFAAGNARVMFLVLLGAVGVLLLIACANVANLLLSRSAHRAREIAVRVAMGATRVRILRQLLLESVILAFVGGLFGLIIAMIGVPMIDAAIQDPGKPYWIIFKVDYAVLAYIAGICILTGILFGLAPALHVSRGNLNDVLNESGRGTAGGHRAQWMSSTMVVVELALTILLLVGAGLMIRSFMSLYRLDIGIATDRLMAMRLQLPQSKYPEPQDRQAFYDRLEPRLIAIAGVDAIAVTTTVPPFGTGRRPFEIEGRPARQGDDESLAAYWVTVSPRFFDVVRAPVSRGRVFNAVDGSPGNETVIISQRMAAQFFPGEDPLGRRIRFTQADPASGRLPVWRTIVGVAPQILYNSPQELQPPAVVYVPQRQEPPGGATLLVRSQLPPPSVIDAIRDVVRSVDRDQPVFTIQTLDEMLAESRWPYRVFGNIFAIVAIVALALSAIGLYAVMAYSVTQRTQEIGLRMALGAESRQVSWLILKRGLIQLGIGLTLGLAAALAVTRVMRRLLIGVTPTDPATFTFITLLLTIVAVAACLLPARRATRVDPLVALRAE